MTIYITKESLRGYDYRTDHPISLYELFGEECYPKEDSLAQFGKRVEKFADCFESFLESFPEGKAFLKQYVAQSIVPGLSYKDEDIHDTF